MRALATPDAASWRGRDHRGGKVMRALLVGIFVAGVAVLAAQTLQLGPWSPGSEEQAKASQDSDRVLEIDAGAGEEAPAPAGEAAADPSAERPANQGDVDRVGTDARVVLRGASADLREEVPGGASEPDPAAKENLRREEALALLRKASASEDPVERRCRRLPRPTCRTPYRRSRSAPAPRPASSRLGRRRRRRWTRQRS